MTADVVTLTANPSLDRTLELPGPLARGGVLRVTAAATEPGGKGVNVARALAAAGTDVVCVLPAADDDELVAALHRLGLRLATVPVGTPVRTNYTVAEPGGTTTKLNEPGVPLGAPTRAALASVVRQQADGARWVVLSGSLPPGTPAGWYADLVAAARSTRARDAVDTSGEPLRALLDTGPDAAPDLLKPNAEELAELTGTTEADLLTDPGAALAAVRSLHALGVGTVLLTLGSDGAVLSSGGGVWSARPPRVAVRSTVGAGDSSLAGYLLADLAGASPAERLRLAVAYGAASAALPGSAVPTPAQVDGAAVRVTAGPPGSSTAAPRTPPPGTPPPGTPAGGSAASVPTPVPAAGRDPR